jgi:Na+/melibiose symporter-like transporter
MELSQLVPVLQLSVVPTIIISACGLLLLTMTNRLGRVVDRSRSLCKERPATVAAQRDTLDLQLDILLQRGRLIRTAILWACLSFLTAVLIMITIFVFSLIAWSGAPILVAVLFTLCLCGLLLCLLNFMMDIHRSLRALDAEILHSRNG